MTQREFESATRLTVGQIARAAGIADNRTLKRLLSAGGVRVLQVGRRSVVERLALQGTMPAFYEAVLSRIGAAEVIESDWA